MVASDWSGASATSWGRGPALHGHLRGNCTARPERPTWRNRPARDVAPRHRRTPRLAELTSSGVDQCGVLQHGSRRCSCGPARGPTARRGPLVAVTAAQLVVGVSRCCLESGAKTVGWYAEIAEQAVGQSVFGLDHAEQQDGRGDARRRCVLRRAVTCRIGWVVAMAARVGGRGVRRDVGWLRVRRFGAQRRGLRRC